MQCIFFCFTFNTTQNRWRLEEAGKYKCLLITPSHTILQLYFTHYIFPFTFVESILTNLKLSRGSFLWGIVRWKYNYDVMTEKPVLILFLSLTNVPIQVLTMSRVAALFWVFCLFYGKICYLWSQWFSALPSALLWSWVVVTVRKYLF